jgi:hypothetical protein
MEKFQELRDKAKQKLQLADHTLVMTYPIVKDSRLLLSSLENLFLAFSYGMTSILHYELTFKRVPPFQNNFTYKLDLFKEKCMPKYNIDTEHLKIMGKIRDIVVAHRNSPIEFPRKDNFIICNDEYDTTTISANDLKEYIEKAKLFIKNVSTIVGKDEEIFR